MRLTAVVFDWAGTLVDHGSRAPTATLGEIFAEAGVAITAHEARLSMGIAKRDHIAAILALPRVAAEWARVHGREPRRGGGSEAADLDLLYARFIPKQQACLEQYSELIEGVLPAVEQLRCVGVKIGSTTGYTRPMLDFLLERAAAQGLVPDCALCPSDVPGGGRPAPWMCYRNAIEMQAGPLWTMVKIGDTPSDIAEGLNAGMWTIGISRTGNEVGLSVSEWEALPAEAKADALAVADRRLREAGAHYVAESVGGCQPIIDEIDARVTAGEKP